MNVSNAVALFLMMTKLLSCELKMITIMGLLSLRMIGLVPLLKN